MANGLNWKALAGVGGLFLGIYLFFAGLLASANINFLWFNPQIFNLLKATYPGFSASFGGAIIGLLWGLVDGAVCGAIFGGLYNWLAKKF